MAACIRVYIIMCFVCVDAAVRTGKALYCRDPDTNKLHAVNSTWQSTTFCGNYSCKLRKLNRTETEYLPIRQINITDLQEDQSIDLDTSPSMIHTQIDNSIQDILNRETKVNLPENSDRYLTETEIKSIADMLHTVKKSDLDAIVEIYKIAQDIYKEVDRSSENNVEETIDTVNEDRSFQKEKQHSYWYEPLHISAQKGLPVDSDKQETVVAPTRKPDPGFFNGALSSSDFGKLPYYYPMTSFQRASSYVHKPLQSCDKADHAIIDRVLKTDQSLKTPIPYSLPYIQQYNNSLYNLYSNPWAYWDYYRNYPYAYVAQVPTNIFRMPENPEVSKEEAGILDNLLAKVKETKLPEWKTDPLSPQVLEEVRANIEKSRLLKPFPLRKKVNLERVGKLIKLDEFTRVKRSSESIDNGFVYDVYLETVTGFENGLDSQLDTVGGAAVGISVLGRTTSARCRSDTQPGFFRMGDQSQQYPDCCPQRIDNNND